MVLSQHGGAYCLTLVDGRRQGGACGFGSQHAFSPIGTRLFSNVI